MHRAWILLGFALALAASVTNAGEPKRQSDLLVVLIGGMDSDPTSEQIRGTAARGRGNSGLYQLQGDLNSLGVDTEYFNWNGTRAGKIGDRKPPGEHAICSVIRDRLQAFPWDKVAVVGNSWGGHTAYEVCKNLYECDAPLRVESLVLLDPSSTGRSLKTPKAVPTNVGHVVNYYTRNAFVWGQLRAPRLLNIDLGDPVNGYMTKGGPEYASPFNFPAHVAAEWDDRIHADIRRRVLDLRP